MGVQGNKGGVKQDLHAIVLKDNGKRNIKNPVQDQIKLIDIHQEEDRDREMIQTFMKKYAKIWKYMYTKYHNQAYSYKGKKDFDDMKQKVTQISQAEITKMLKEHNTYPLLINKDEIGTLIRLLNMKSNSTNKRDIAMLDYDQFLEFIPQLVFVCFTRPPMDKSHLPMIE